MRCYKLQGHTPVACDIEEAALLLDESASRRLWFIELPDCNVSTEFLVIDHGHDPDAPPLLFETRIIGGPHYDFRERYATWDDAAEGHARAVQIAGGEVNV